MKKWEYSVVNWDEKISSVEKSNDLEQCLNEYGYDGWEVVSMTHQINSLAETDNFGVSSVKTDSIIIVMKREKQEH